MSAETSYTRTIHVQFKAAIDSSTHHVDATVSEHIDLLTGDESNSVSINTIVDSTSGQTRFTSTLSFDEFRQLTQRARAAAQNTL